MNSIDEIMKYELIVVDMDGTLYFQRPLRRKMLYCMLEGLLIGKLIFREFIALFQFRKKKEKLAGKEYHEDALYSDVAASLPGCLRMTPKEVEKTVHKWIYEIPLAQIPSCGDYYLISILNEAIQRGIKVYVYSDYPAQKKAESLGLMGVTCVSSTDAQIGYLKPCARGIEYILKKSGVCKNSAIMLGDRDEMDGQAARNAGIDYIILNRNARKRYEKNTKSNI